MRKEKGVCANQRGEGYGEDLESDRGTKHLVNVGTRDGGAGARLFWKKTLGEAKNRLRFAWPLK